MVQKLTTKENIDFNVRKKVDAYFENNQARLRYWARGILFRKKANMYDQAAETALVSALYLQCLHLDSADVQVVARNYGSRFVDQEIGLVSYIENGKRCRELRTANSLDAPVNDSGETTTTLGCLVGDGGNRVQRVENDLFLAQVVNTLAKKLNKPLGGRGMDAMTMFLAVRGDEISIEEAENTYGLEWKTVRQLVNARVAALPEASLFTNGETRSKKTLISARANARRETKARNAEETESRKAQKQETAELSGEVVSVTGDRLEELKKLYDPAYRRAAESAAAAKAAAEMAVEVVEPVAEVPAKNAPAKVIPLFPVALADSDPLMDLLRDTAPIQGFLFGSGSGCVGHDQQTLVVYTARQKPVDKPAQNQIPVSTRHAESARDEQLLLAFPDTSSRSSRRRARAAVGSGRSRPANHDRRSPSDHWSSKKRGSPLPVAV